MTQESEELSFVGFKRHDVATRLFGPTPATRPDAPDSERGLAVTQALYTLTDLSRTGIPDPLGGNMDDPTWVLGDRGVRGSTWLRKEWGVLQFRAASEDDVQVLVTIAPLSEQSRHDFAFLERVMHFDRSRPHRAGERSVPRLDPEVLRPR
jgi:hypothetical protein